MEKVREHFNSQLGKVESQKKQHFQMEVMYEVDVAKTQCEGKTQKCLCTNMRRLNMKTGEHKLLAPRDYPCKAGISVALKEHAMLPGYQIYRNDRIGSTDKGIIVCKKLYITRRQK